MGKKDVQGTNFNTQACKICERAGPRFPRPRHFSPHESLLPSYHVLLCSWCTNPRTKQIKKRHISIARRSYHDYTISTLLLLIFALALRGWETEGGKQKEKKLGTSGQRLAGRLQIHFVLVNLRHLFLGRATQRCEGYTPTFFL
jgi:hypothetical protein